MVATKFLSKLFLHFFFFFIAPVFVLAQSGDAVFNLTAENLKNSNFVDTSEANWKYRAGDDANRAAADFDDRDWQAVSDSTGKLEKLPAGDWRGNGWFRLRFKTDESLRGKVVGIAIWQQLAASEIYLDGELVKSFGEIGNEATTPRFVNFYRTPFAVKLADRDEHLLAVRYRSAIENPESFLSGWIYSNAGGNGFYLAFANINETIERREASQQSSYLIGVSRAAVYLAVGFVFLLLFWFYPQQRANLYFGLFAFLTAIGNYIDYFQFANGDAGAMSFVVYRAFNRFLFVLYTLAFLLFLYRAFLSGTPRFFVAATTIWALTNAATVLFPDSQIAETMFGFLTVCFVAECSRVMWLAVRRGDQGAWIVAAGVLTSLLDPLHYLYNLTGLTTPKTVGFYLEFVTNYGMLIAVSIYLARNFARTNKNLEAQLETVKELSARALEHERTEAELRLKHEQERAENERRAKELEEARKLQLSLLPKKLPKLPNLEIAAFMKPATEVGGDYYDFFVGGDGTLTVAIGDATGHGLKAGTMVTATKSLFNNLADEPDIREIFKSSSAALKRMNLRGMFMAMTMAKIKNNWLAISSAGMPPALFYRAASGRVEEFSLKALPLGSPLAGNYEQRELNLAPGDCVLLMSDGFPEMFNDAGEMLGFDKAAEILPDIADRSAQEIVEILVRVASDWANGRPQDDDLTFVVLKINSDAL